MTLEELIRHVGQENITVQNLLNSASGSVSTNKHGVTKITIGTKEITCNQIAMGAEKLGLILWIPKDKLPLGQPPLADKKGGGV